MKRLFPVLLLLCNIVDSKSQDFQNYSQSIPGGSISFEMVAIPGGKFIMGSKAQEKGRDQDEGPQREIEISAFWMAATEVTFAEWDLYFKDISIPQRKTIDGITRATPQYIDLTWGMGREGRHPANSMSHTAAMMYCKWLYAKTGFFFRLPTEAEWEYACRAGKGTTYFFGNDPRALNQYGYFKNNSGNKFHPVAELTPNAWGLYDMVGNLSEWTIDQYDPAYYQKMATKNPITIPGPTYPKTLRGGSYMDEAEALRCASRLASDTRLNVRDPQIPKSKWWLTDGMFIGFRVLRPMKQPPKEEIDQFYNLYLK